jgi:nitrite reductase/ring-hydroxylating ferredoxin subunit
MADSGFVKVAQVSEIRPGEMMMVNVGSEQVLIANVNGNIHACEDICSHAYASLSEGDLNGEEVECPLHGGVFSLITGEALTPPADDPIKLYQVQVDGDDILIAPPQE